MKNPCLNCVDRVLWCHGKCEKHKEYKEYLEDIKKEIKIHTEFVSYTKDARSRMLKDKSKRLKHE